MERQVDKFGYYDRTMAESWQPNLTTPCWSMRVAAEMDDTRNFPVR